jgi:hypothetical protein
MRSGPIVLSPKADRSAADIVILIASGHNGRNMKRFFSDGWFYTGTSPA